MNDETLLYSNQKLTEENNVLTAKTMMLEEKLEKQIEMNDKKQIRLNKAMSYVSKMKKIHPEIEGELSKLMNILLRGV